MLSVVLPVILALPAVLAHGQVRSFTSSSGTWTSADAYTTANASSPIRKLNTYGPAAGFTGINITCGEGGNTPVSVLATVKAGELVTFDWGSWSSSHSGPVMTYIAKCTNGCANFKGDSGNIWVKIDQDGYHNSTTRAAYPWGENLLHLTPSAYKVTIPAGLANGEYLLRHEILGLHVASTVMGAQFYPNCVQIQVTNGGSVSLPTGIALPGAYDPNDTLGILVELWKVQQGLASYTPPGGAVLLKGGSGSWGTDTYGA
ncbi:glycoside hydrolase [Auriculariales sp. MPI-PUGE-AT-0066]|nr:glycoside hydrolase [Auriculariales sp. MPI-PUGE-AT-0066]